MKRKANYSLYTPPKPGLYGTYCSDGIQDTKKLPVQRTNTGQLGQSINTSLVSTRDCFRLSVA